MLSFPLPRERERGKHEQRKAPKKTTLPFFTQKAAKKYYSTRVFLFLCVALRMTLLPVPQPKIAQNHDKWKNTTTNPTEIYIYTRYMISRYIYIPGIWFIYIYVFIFISLQLRQQRVLFNIPTNENAKTSQLQNHTEHHNKLDTNELKEGGGDRLKKYILENTNQVCVSLACCCARVRHQSEAVLLLQTTPVPREALVHRRQAKASSHKFRGNAHQLVPPTK